MTAAAPQDGAPAPKAAVPRLDARAARPPVIRLRRAVVTAAVMGGAGLVASALAWAFVVQPELRARAHDARLEGRAPEGRGAVRPADVVASAPGSYAQLDRLPEPRTLGPGSREAPEPAAARPKGPAQAVRTSSRSTGDAQSARASRLFFEASTGPRGPGPESPAAGDRRDYGAVYNTHALLPPLSPFEVKAGAVIPAALLTAIDTARGGPVVATVTENVFDSVSGRHLLAPQGSRLLGRHEGESRHGDRRAFIVWERLLLPNGKSLVLPGEPGVDAQGAVGVVGRVDRRLVPLAVATLFAGAITTLGQAARDGDEGGGLLGDAGDAAAIEAAQVGGRLIDRELEVRPSIRLRAGARVRVLVTRDLVLEPYRP